MCLESRILRVDVCDKHTLKYSFIIVCGERAIKGDV